jgi:hypothetical protein
VTQKKLCVILLIVLITMTINMMSLTTITRMRPIVVTVQKTLKSLYMRITIMLSTIVCSCLNSLLILLSLTSLEKREGSTKHFITRISEYRCNDWYSFRLRDRYKVYHKYGSTLLENLVGYN